MLAPDGRSARVVIDGGWAGRCLGPAAPGRFELLQRLDESATVQHVRRLVEFLDGAPWRSVQGRDSEAGSDPRGSRSRLELGRHHRIDMDVIESRAAEAFHRP
jgi:hypothetical protein